MFSSNTEEHLKKHSSRFEFNTKTQKIISAYFVEQDSHPSILFKQSIIELLNINDVNEKDHVNIQFKKYFNYFIKLKWIIYRQALLEVVSRIKK